MNLRIQSAVRRIKQQLTVAKKAYEKTCKRKGKALSKIRKLCDHPESHRIFYSDIYESSEECGVCGKEAKRLN
jgi:hypothetical protein